MTLKNEGYDAYKPEIFGKRIVVTRRFTIQGASSYKIMSDKKVIISTKKVDLGDICDHMSIQVDNPLNVLTQGASLYKKRSMSLAYDLFNLQIPLGRQHLIILKVMLSYLIGNFSVLRTPKTNMVFVYYSVFVVEVRLNLFSSFFFGVHTFSSSPKSTTSSTRTSQLQAPS